MINNERAQSSVKENQAVCTITHRRLDLGQSDKQKVVLVQKLGKYSAVSNTCNFNENAPIQNKM